METEFCFEFSFIFKLQMTKLTMVTGNREKKIHFASLHPEMQFQNLDLPELQGPPIEVAKAKCREAARQIQGPVMIEDTSLCFDALGGLPGPYIKWFVRDTGLEGLFKMLAAFPEQRGATALSTIAYTTGPDAEPVIFQGRTRGTIVAPRGDNGAGWDAIFQPNGMQVTLAEMEEVDKPAVNGRMEAFEGLKAHIF